MNYGALLKILLLLACLANLIYAFPVFLQLYNRLQKGEGVAADRIEWSIQAVNDEEFRPKAHYRYTVKGKTYEHEEVFQGVKYRNPYAAEGQLSHLTEVYPLVRYNPESPEKGTLENYFSVKRATYSIMLWALLGYAVYGVRYYQKTKFPSTTL